VRLGGFRRSVFACFLFSGLIVAAGAASGALADDWLRLPSLTYASDAELGPIDRTGFILSPDLSINDKVNLGGSGGALLEDPSGFALGARAGYDYQVGDVLLGMIADGYYSFADGGGNGVFKSELHYYGTVRGRLGLGIGRFLPYVTGGYAYGELKVSNNVTGVSGSETLSGWTYGGGVEFVWNRDITLYGGYRRIDFDDRTFAALPAGQNTLSPEIDIIDFGWIHRF
jgi:outer membrane immunogenic protein